MELELGHHVTPPNAKTPTAKQVAALAKVSPITVSRTLSGGKNVRADVQKRVFDAIEQLGYVRNESARTIRPGQRSGLIGVVITNIGNPYYGQFALGVERIAAERGRKIILGNTGEEIDRERQLVGAFVGQQAEGLIVVPAGASEMKARHLESNRVGGIPVVLASRTIEDLETDTVLLEDFEGAYTATSDLIMSGHSRIAFVGNVLSVSTARQRRDGFLTALRDGGVDPQPEYMAAGQLNSQSAKDRAKLLLKTSPPPTAIFCANNRNAIGVLQAISELGPLDPMPTVVSFDDLELASLLPMPMLIVSHDPAELGSIAAQLLFDRIDGIVTGAPRTLRLPVSVYPSGKRG